MVSTSNEGILTEYLVKYAALRFSPQGRSADLLETLYMTECYRAGRDLLAARAAYDGSVWIGVSPEDLDSRLDALDVFMAALARDRCESWGVTH